MTNGGAGQSTGQVGGGTGGAGPAIDPLKILQKYLWLLVAFGIVGVVLGLGGFFVLREIAPQYTSTTIFEVEPLQTSLEDVSRQLEDDERLLRLMATEAQTMTSPRILTAVVENPAMRAALPEWYEPFLTGTSLDVAAAVKQLDSSVKASPSDKTSFIALSVSAADARTAQQIGDFLYQVYDADLKAKSNQPYAERRIQLRNAIQRVTGEIESEARRRRRLVEENEIDQLNAPGSQAGQAMRAETLALTQLQQTKTSAEVQLEEYVRVLNSPSGITYPDDILAQVEVQPQVAQLQNQIRQTRAAEAELERLGLGPNHRDRKALSARIRGFEDELASTREQESVLLFNQQIDQLRLLLRQITAREAELLDSIETLRAELNALTNIIQEVEDIDRGIVSLQQQLATLQATSAELQELVNAGSVARISRVQSASFPSQPSFPQLIPTVAVSLVLVIGLVGGLIVLKEITDQRVKGPADIAMIPRTRVLGVIPDTAEDPSRPARPETAFRDHPNGVFAEAIRQLRAPLLKRCLQQGHKTVLVVPSTPNSGSTTLIANLAEACGRTEMSVLVIDANTRRPNLHNIYQDSEGPGLADIIVGAVTLDEAVRQTQTPNVHFLPAGSPANRAFESTASPRVDELLTSVRDRYDIVLLDVAPAIVSGDANGLANRCDASILVARAFNEKRGMVARLKNNLVEAKCEFLGVVVNAVRASAGGYFKENMQRTHEYQSRPAKPEADAA
ncbi:MAG: polysaccharide biosynthesis tyrosine autokinase [Planctomycetota bacterium]